VALLHYSNLVNNRPDKLMTDTFYGLQDFFQFLDTTKKYTESEKAIKHIGWEKVVRDELNDSQKGVWVQLVEPKREQDDFENSLKSFLDESNKSVYEANDANWSIIGAASRECTKCKKDNGKAKIAYQSESHALEAAKNSKFELDTYKCPKGEGWHLTKQIGSGIRFDNDCKIKILDRDSKLDKLLLEKIPQENYLVIRPNTYQLMCQIRAIKALQNAPTNINRPLLRLFDTSNYVTWPNVSESLEEITTYKNPVEKWLVLTDDQRPGTDEQCNWVNLALNTPDFAFLEGPPGSGKTTAICELVMQLVLRGKRVLLCASNSGWSENG